MVVADAVMRKLPGVLGSRGQRGGGVLQRGARGRPEYPHYTRPAEWRGHGGARTCCCRATTRASRPGGSSRAAAGPAASRERPDAWERVSSSLPFAAARGRVPQPPRPLRVMCGVIDSIERAQLRRVPAFQAGDRVRVHFQVVEGTRRRTQVFEGVVLKRQGSGARETFTVRKQSFGVGVERTFPVHSPKIEQIEVAGRGDVRRAKLYYLRDRVGRGARVRERRFGGRGGGARGGSIRVEGAMPPPEVDEAAVAGESDPRDEGVEEVCRAGGRGRRGGRGGPRSEDAAPEEAAAAPRSPPPRSPPPRSPLPRSPPPRRTNRPRIPSPTSGRGLTASPQGPDSRRGTRQEGAERGRLADRAGHDRRRGARSRAGHPGFPRQAVPDPERVDGPDPRGGPAGPRRSSDPALHRSRARRHHGVQAADVARTRTSAARATRRAPPAPGRRKERSDTNFIKRVVAVGGDRLSVRGGRVYINGKLQKEPFIRPDDECSICNLPRPDQDPGRATSS